MARPVFRVPSRQSAGPPPSKRLRPSGSPPARPVTAEFKEPPDLWAIKHAPTSCTELALHKAKIEEIHHALDPSEDTRVVVVSGPAGSSKSTAVRLVCTEQNRKMLEFLAPETSVGMTSVMQSFREFLVGAAMYARSSTIVFVDDIPNVFHEETCRLFEEALIQWAREPAEQPLLVIAFTEMEVSAQYNEAAVVPRVLGRLVAMQDYCRWIRVNPVNATLIGRTLKYVLAREKQACSAVVLREISQCGDIRNAITALELYLKMAPSSTGGAGSAASLVRGFPVQLFHAVGKVVWGTSKDGSLEEALEAFSDTLITFNLTVLDNYCIAKHARLSVFAAAAAAESLSEADARGIHASAAYVGALTAAQVIAASEPDERCGKRFENLRFTQLPRWRREEHEARARLIAHGNSSRLYLGPTSAAAVRDEIAYEGQLRRVQSTALELLESDDDDDDDNF